MIDLLATLASLAAQVPEAATVASSVRPDQVADAALRIPELGLAVYAIRELVRSQRTRLKEVEALRDVAKALGDQVERGDRASRRHLRAARLLEHALRQGCGAVKRASANGTLPAAEQPPGKDLT